MGAENEARQRTDDVPDNSVSNTGVVILVLSPSRRQWKSLMNPIVELANPMNWIKAEVVDEMKDEEMKADNDC